MTKLTRQNVIVYITKIRLNFENAYPTHSDNEFDLLLESWYEALCVYPKEICDKAVNNALRKAKFAPRLGDITEEIEKIASADQKTDEELWVELTSTLYEVFDTSRYLPYPQHNKAASEKLNAIFNGLDDKLKMYLVNVNTLIELSELDKSALPYEKTRFFKQIGIIRSKQAERNMAKEFLLEVEKHKQLKGRNSD